MSRFLPIARALCLTGVLLLAAGTPWIAPQPATAAESFVPGFEDLPLMPGLAVVPEAGLLFDKPDGRIVEAVATGRVSAADLTAFYAATLPQLGWAALAGTPGRIKFRREGEVLNINHAAGRAGLTVRFSLSPR